MKNLSAGIGPQRETSSACERSEPKTRVLKGRNILAWAKAGGRRPRYGAQEQFHLFFSIRFGAPRFCAPNRMEKKRGRPQKTSFTQYLLVEAAGLLSLVVHNDQEVVAPP